MEEREKRLSSLPTFGAADEVQELNESHSLVPRAGSGSSRGPLRALSKHSRRSPAPSSHDRAMRSKQQSIGLSSLTMIYSISYVTGKPHCTESLVVVSSPDSASQQ